MEAAKPETSELSIVLADDHKVVRSALRMLLEAEPDLAVVAEAGTADDAVRYVRGHKPTVLILDLDMPGRPSLEAIPDIFEACPDTRIVILTMRSEPEFARQALKLGVLGYVLKEAADDELVQAVRSAAAGETYLQPALGATTRRRVRRSGRRRPDRAGERHPGADRPGAHQLRDRRATLPEHPHRRNPPRQSAGET